MKTLLVTWLVATCTIAELSTVSAQNYSWSTIAGVSGAGNSGTNDGIGSVARFSSPIEIAVDGNTNVYVSDFGNNKIRKLVFNPGTSNWVVSTLSASIAGPHGVASDAAGANLYVVQTASLLRVKKLAVQQNGSWTLSDVTSTFYEAGGIALDVPGNLFYANVDGNKVDAVTPVGQSWSDLVISGPRIGNDSGSLDGTNNQASLSGPNGICALATTNLLVTDSNNRTIRQIVRYGTNWVTTTICGQLGNAGSADGIGTNALFSSPAGMAVDGTGKVFIADQGNNTIRRMVWNGSNWSVSTVGGLPNGSPGAQDGTGTAASFNHPTGIAADGNGNLFVADFANNTIRMGTPSIVSNQPPALQIFGSGQNVLLMWPQNGGGFTLQSSSNLASGPWITVGGIKTNFVFSGQMTNSNLFYRLAP